ncbi:MAG: hypothetical protein K6G36_00905 [Candidatus Saccharibacteria bacterium]|nr:hypothetical protein [Candidatus Saccharibacteria bacterium]
MKQNENAGTPVAPVAENTKQKCGKGAKIVAAIACIAAICGIGFGVYSLMQVSNKDSQIANLKTQIKKLETVEMEPAVLKPETDNCEANKEPVTIETDTDISDDGKSFSANVLTSIKNLGGSTYGFKSSRFGEGTVYAYINSDGDLILEKDKKYTVASNVIFADFLWEGNGGAPSLYFVKDDGTVGAVKGVTYDTESPVSENIATTSKAVLVRNVTTESGHKVVIVDVDGNLVDL